MKWSRGFLLLSLSLSQIFLPFPSLAQGNVISPFCTGGVTSGVSTAIGCLFAHNPNQFIGQILGWAVILGAGIAFIIIAISGFQISTAAGDPKRMQAARELLFSAISGLALIIFSIFLLNLIGFKILDLGSLGLPTPNF